jgi:glycosyltransferase involved in cell wall biosynthesis
MISITYIISDIDKALAFEWVAQYLDKSKFSLSFIIINPGPSHLETFLKENNYKVKRVTCAGKQEWLKSIYTVFKILKKERPNIIHCHLLQANIIGLTAAWLAGIKMRVYTRHHSSFHHKYFPKGVWWDKLANKFSTHIIAISSIVKKILVEWEHVNSKKVVLIPHGFKLEEFDQVANARVSAFKERNNLPDGYCVGVISRFTVLKGIQYIIPAFERFLQEEPNAFLLMLNAHGDYEEVIKELLQKLPSESYRLVKFEHDIAAAYKVMDVFIHVPIDKDAEAFGQIYVEALAAGVPSIFTRSGIANDFCYNEELAEWVDYKNEEQIYKSLRKLTSDRLKRELVINAGKSFAQQFNLPVYIKRLEELYSL